MKLLKFYADWCQPCKQQGTVLEGLTDVEIVPINIESEENQSLVETYRVRGLPTLILLDQEEKELTRFVGITTLDKIKEEIKKYDDIEELEQSTQLQEETDS